MYVIHGAMDDREPAMIGVFESLHTANKWMQDYSEYADHEKCTTSCKHMRERCPKPQFLKEINYYTSCFDTPGCTKAECVAASDPKDIIIHQVFNENGTYNISSTHVLEDYEPYRTSDDEDEDEEEDEEEEKKEEKEEKEEEKEEDLVYV